MIWYKIAEFLEKAFFCVSGGRPMTDCGLAFIDVVSGKSVRYFRDHSGRLWLADNGRWSLFRVEASEGAEDGYR